MGDTVILLSPEHESRFKRATVLGFQRVTRQSPMAFVLSLERVGLPRRVQEGDRAWVSLSVSS